MTQPCAAWDWLLQNWNFLSRRTNKQLVKCDASSRLSSSPASWLHLSSVSVDPYHILYPDSPRPSLPGGTSLTLPVSPPCLLPSPPLRLDLNWCHELWLQLHSLDSHLYSHLWTLPCTFYASFQTSKRQVHLEKKPQDAKILKLNLPKIKFITILSKTCLPDFLS